MSARRPGAEAVSVRVHRSHLLPSDALPGALAVIALVETGGRPPVDRRAERVLLPRMLAHLGCPGGYLVARTRTGRPYLVDAATGARREPSFNIAHSGHWIAVALSAYATVGVDIQQEPVSDWTRIAQRWLHPVENARIAAMPQARRTAYFTQLWAVREARCKATGAGLAGFRTAEPVPSADSGELGGVRWVSLPNRPGYAGALAWLGGDATPAEPQTVLVCCASRDFLGGCSQ